MYLYFEAVLISYGQIYHFNSVLQGLSYIYVLVGCYLMAALYISYLHIWLIEPSLGGQQIDLYEIFGNDTIIPANMPTIGILIFGWISYLWLSLDCFHDWRRNFWRHDLAHALELPLFLGPAFSTIPSRISFCQ